MLITWKRRCSLSNQFYLTLQSVPLDRVYLFKYLGVLISHNLSWSAHISDIVARSKKIVGFIYRKFYRFCNTNTLRKLYLSLVRSILKYCCHIWDPFLSKDIELLESLQKFASKVCTKQWHEPYNFLWTSPKLPLSPHPFLQQFLFASAICTLKQLLVFLCSQFRIIVEPFACVCASLCLSFLF